MGDRLDPLTVKSRIASLRCNRCGASPTAIGIGILDPQTGKIVRMVKCECGKLTWLDDREAGPTQR